VTHPIIFVTIRSVIAAAVAGGAVIMVVVI
jgi:hypothetical protein